MKKEILILLGIAAAFFLFFKKRKKSGYFAKIDTIKMTTVFDKKHGWTPDTPSVTHKVDKGDYIGSSEEYYTTIDGVSLFKQKGKVWAFFENHIEFKA